MAATFAEDFEVYNESDLLKLKEIWMHGIPDGQRRECWELLLRIDTTTFISHEPFYSKQSRGQVERYCRQRGLYIQDLMEKTISAYLSKTNSQFSAYLVPIAGPCCLVFQQFSIQGFIALMSRIEDWQSEHSLHDQVSNCLTLFRTLIPELYSHFQDEEVDCRLFLSSWFEGLLSKELTIDCILRLWDHYFVSPTQFQDHVYICLAILSQFKEDLEELEQSEIHSFLNRMSGLNMEAIIAISEQLKFKSAGLGSF